MEDGPITVDLDAVIDRHQKFLNITRVQIERNEGLAKALNKGLTFCEYDLIARMDADDTCESQRFEKQYNYLKKNTDIAALSTA